ncbi:MAG: molybdenum cofactor guanylyltransferase [Cyanobacteria bacterium P01_A01_bin.83]
MTKLIKDKITALILAGGESSRMGKDKALLQIDGKALLTRICLVAHECAAQAYVITPWIEKYQDIVPSSCELLSEQLILDAPSNTPIIGFAQGMQSVKTEWTLLLACDLPYLASSQVKQWSSALATVLPTEIALLPRTGDRWEPMCGFYRRCCLDTLSRYISQGGRSFQAWLKQNSVKELSISDRSILFNCNTPQDWKTVNSQQSTVNS